MHFILCKCLFLRGLRSWFLCGDKRRAIPPGPEMTTWQVLPEWGERTPKTASPALTSPRMATSSWLYWTPNSPKIGATVRWCDDGKPARGVRREGLSRAGHSRTRLGNTRTVPRESGLPGGRDAHEAWFLNARDRVISWRLSTVTAVLLHLSSLKALAL